MKKVTLKEFYQKMRKKLALSIITEESTLEDKKLTQFTNRPGLALAGYFERFSFDRIQILGETEISYLQSLEYDIIFSRLNEIFVHSIPCVIVSKGLSIPAIVIDRANDNNIAILGSRLNTEELTHKLKMYLDNEFALTQSIHGSFVSIYGVGIFITGSPGIGKSELALDLVERGHRLIADDLVKIEKKNDTLIGSPPHDDPNFGYFLEVRGVGIINIERMFGIQAVLDKKEINIQVELVHAKENVHYDRTGGSMKYNQLLDVRTPIIYLPVAPGKNVSVILEIIALNFTSKRYGYDGRKVYFQKVNEEIAKRSKIRNKLLKSDNDN